MCVCVNLNTAIIKILQFNINIKFILYKYIQGVHVKICHQFFGFSGNLVKKYFRQCI